MSPSRPGAGPTADRLLPPRPGGVRARPWAALALTLVLSTLGGCIYLGPADSPAVEPTPSQSPSPSPIQSEPSPSPPPSASTTPRETPVLTSPATSVTPSQAPTWADGELAWTRLALLPAGVSSASPLTGVVWGDVYVLGGMEVVANAEIGLGWSGALWESTDGVTWQRSDELVQLDGTPITSMAQWAGGLIAAGPAGFCFMHCSTGFLADQGTAIFRATAGDDWQRLIRPSGVEHGLIRGLAAGDDFIVATGLIPNPEQPVSPPPYPDGTEALAQVWRSADGVEWQPAQGVPRSHVIGRPVERGGVFATLLGDRYGEEPMRILLSTDGSAWKVTYETWSIEHLVASPVGFLAVAEDLEAHLISSEDGHEWIEQPFNLVDADSSFLHALDWIGDRYLALGWREAGGDLPSEMGRWTSVDGHTWLEGESPPDLPPDAAVDGLIPLGDGAIVLASAIGGERAVWFVRPDGQR